jgi:hypothetical protein
MFHVKHRERAGGERRWREWFHVKHRGGGLEKHDSAKQPHALKNHPLFSIS